MSWAFEHDSDCILTVVMRPPGETIDSVLQFFFELILSFFLTEHAFTYAAYQTSGTVHEMLNFTSLFTVLFACVYEF